MKRRNLILLIVVEIIVLAGILLWLVLRGDGAPPGETETDPTMPWSAEGKTPEEYSWEEFQELTDLQQESFFESFDSPEAFEDWMNEAKPETEPTQEPWRPELKEPEAYTWEEYQALDDEKKDSFYESFDSPEAFEAWLQKVNPQILESTAQTEVALEENPWENGGKSPEEYTWEEFQTLTEDQQESFFLSFESNEKFEAWMERVNPQ